LAEEFTDLYVFHLRGNQRTSGERSRREGGKVFGSGSRAPIAISVFVKNPEAFEQGRIFFHDIGDYLSQKEKLSIISGFGSVNGITKSEGWVAVTPDEQNDWLNQRDDSFKAFIPVGEKGSSGTHSIFSMYSLGAATNRDKWVYNASLDYLASNVERTIQHYNAELERSKGIHGDIKDFLNSDPTKISWTRALRNDIKRGKALSISDGEIVRSVYRPYEKQWLFFGRRLNETISQLHRLFPTPNVPNRVILLPGLSSRVPFMPLMVENIYDLNLVDGGVQGFPQFFFDQHDEESGGLFESETSSLQRREAITDAGLKHFQEAYPGETITKEDLFYYVYGLLHSEDYRTKYADNLTKELPRIPRVKTAADFWAFSRAGRELGDLHVNYETVHPYPVTIKQGDLRLADIKNPEAFYRVTKWTFGKSGKDKDKTTVIYNANITMQDVPLEAYDYVVNGKPALEWVMERQVVKTDKASGIENDANRYAIETMGNPAYPLELFQRVITVSLRTMEIVRGLPKLEVME
jgi:predicted helicase